MKQGLLRYLSDGFVPIPGRAWAIAIITSAGFLPGIITEVNAQQTAAPPTITQACDGPSADPEVHGLHERVIAHDGLAKYAIKQFGAPATCRGWITAVFDGASFGILELVFSGDASLRVETMPPESSRVTLSVPSGFPDARDAERLIHAYVDRIGIEIDWSQPTTTRVGDETTIRYNSPEMGSNAFVEMGTVDGVFNKLRFSMAL